MQNLQKEFSDLSVSLLTDVTKTCDNDPVKAADMLRTLAIEERRQKDKKIDDIHKQFSSLPREVVATILAENNLDEDASIVPLFNKINELKQKQELKSKRKREKIEKLRRQEEVKKQIVNLMDIFQNIPKETIQRILDENEGDIQDTTNQLLFLVSQQEDNKKKETEKKKREREEKRMREEDERMKNLKFEALREKFNDLSTEEVTGALEKNKWDIKEACKYLVTYSAEKKKDELKALFQSFRDDEIQAALETNDWNTAETAQNLATMRENRKREAEVIKKEVEKEGMASINIIKVQQSLLERSIMIGNEMVTAITKDDENKRRQQEEETRAQFKKELGHILTVQAQNGPSPGLVPPPLPKEIDILLGKKKPVEDEEVTQEIVEEKPSPVSVSQEKTVSGVNKSGLSVTLKACPAVVDSGNSIEVEYVVLDGNSTAYDWIGLFSVDQPNKQYVTYDWRGKQEKKGTVTFTAPTVYGVYEFRYFPSSSYEHAAMSNKIVVGPQIEMKASLEKEKKKFKVVWNQKSGNEYRRSWIGLFEKSKPNKQFIAWEYAGKPGVEILFDAPVKPVDYEFRLFSTGYLDVARSNTITIEGTDQISASLENGSVIVKVNIVTVDPYYDGVWMGLFFIDQENNNKWRRYKYVTDRTADVVFKAPKTAGQYEARLFANKTYDCVLKSNQFAIPEAK